VGEQPQSGKLVLGVGKQALCDGMSACA